MSFPKWQRTQGKRSAPERKDIKRTKVIRRWLLLTAGGLVVAAAVGAITFAQGEDTFEPTSGGPPVDPVLAASAKAIHFHSTMNPSVGKIEEKQANEATPSENQYLLQVGSTAPEFVLNTPTGEEIRFSAYLGQTVLLEFFATWCPGCQAETKHLINLVNGLPSSSVAILAVNADGEDAGSVFAFDRYFGILYPTLLDPSSRPGNFNHRGGAGTVSTAYKIRRFPTFYIVDGKGTIVWRSVGEQPDALIESELRAASKE